MQETPSPNSPALSLQKTLTKIFNSPITAIHQDEKELFRFTLTSVQFKKLEELFKVTHATTVFAKDISSAQPIPIGWISDTRYQQCSGYCLRKDLMSKYKLPPEEASTFTPTMLTSKELLLKLDYRLIDEQPASPQNYPLQFISEDKAVLVNDDDYPLHFIIIAPSTNSQDEHLINHKSRFNEPTIEPWRTVIVRTQQLNHEFYRHHKQIRYQIYRKRNSLQQNITTPPPVI